MASFWSKNKLVQTKKKSLKESSWFGKPKCKLRSKVVHFFVFCFSFIGFVLLLFEFYDDGKYVMDWGHCENTPAPSFLINSKIGMFGFVHPHKVITRRSAFSTFPNAQNGGESEGGAKSGRLKCQFSQMERDINLQEIPKLVPILKKKTSRKKTIC